MIRNMLGEYSQVIAHYLFIFCKPEWQSGIELSNLNPNMPWAVVQWDGGYVLFVNEGFALKPISMCKIMPELPSKSVFHGASFVIRLFWDESQRLTCFNSFRSRLATVANTKLSNLSLDKHINEPKMSLLLFSQRICLSLVLSNWTL